MSQVRPVTGPPAPAGKAAGKAAAPSASPRLGLALVVIATAQLMVLLDATIVNVALPHIQRALGFSGSGLEWVVNAYALAFGGLMLLGGRAGDLLGRRKVFIAGLLLFAAASLAGGFATSQPWLLAARAIQGLGGALVAPAALSLITTTFAEGKARNRAMGVYAAMSVAGGAVGLLAGGLLTTYASWRWVLFVNVPIGLAAALGATRVLRESPRQRGRFDLGGAITGTGGVTALVYGLANAATSPDGTSHWGDAKVVASLAASAVLLGAFAVIETRTEHPLLPVRLLADRNRTGANLIMLCVGAAIAGMFFFLTVFMEVVWGYSALKTGLAYLPLTAGIMVSSGAAAQLVSRIGARPLLPAGALAAGGGMYWLSRISEHTSYAGGVLGPVLVIAVGLGLLFVPVTLVAMSRVADRESGVAASLRNTGQMVGGSIGLAVLGSVAWTVTANSARAQAAHAAAAAGAGHPARPSHAALTAVYHHALATGFSRAFVVTAGIMLLALIISLAAIRVKRADLGEGRP
ncbi:MAG: MFS transporter [Actinobacteria bacterium]|nr:MFS transporter [Actinomycetota bacterium]